jgi:hypothetical protein
MRAVLLVAVLLSPVAAEGAPSKIGGERKLGVGLQFGEPFGITGKLWLSRDLAVSALLGSGFSREGLRVAADVTYNLRDLVANNSLEIGAYFGGGVATGFWYHDQRHTHDEPYPHQHTHPVYDPLLAFRAVGGGAMFLKTIPLEVFAEIGPGFEMLTRSGLIFTGGLGARFYF